LIFIKSIDELLFLRLEQLLLFKLTGAFMKIMMVRITTSIMTLVFVLSCGQMGSQLRESGPEPIYIEENFFEPTPQNPVTDTIESAESSEVTTEPVAPAPPVEVSAPEVVTPLPADSMETTLAPLAWESNSATKLKYSRWSKMIYQIIQKKTPQILSQNVADDVETFCPRYRVLKESERLNFWAQFFVGLAKYESSWEPTTSSVEHNMSGVDSVTGQKIVSEGLLQLSYQDEKNYPIQCDFNWPKDKLLPQKDARRTILDPYLNLNCGLQIFAHQLKRFRRIVVKDPKQLYWAVLFNGRSNKIKEIAKMTKSLSFCK
jgi:hypothetical protein